MLDFQGIIARFMEALSFLGEKTEAAGMIFLPPPKTIKAYFLISLHGADDFLGHALASKIINVARR
jgi:hypothetical protein